MNYLPDRLLTLSLLAVALLPTGSYAADDWPFVRGPHFDGHSTEQGLAESWPAEGPPVLWTRELGQGYSAFVASGDRVYTQAQSVTGQYVYCLDASTGTTIWEHRYDWPYEAAGVYPGPRSTPTIYEKRVYFTSPAGVLGCLQASDGTETWSVDLDAVYGIGGSGFGYSCSPTLIDGMVIVPVGGKGSGVVAFDARTGKEMWKSTSDLASYTPAFPIELDGKPLVVCYMQNCLLVLSRTNGDVYLRVPLSRGYDEHSAWPIYSEPNLWIAAPFKAGSKLLDLSTTEAKAIWASNLLSNDVCSSVCVDGNIYGFDILDIQSKTHRPSKGIFRCVDFLTGKERWSNGSGRPRRSSNKDDFLTDIGQSGIIAADGKLVVLNELGELILLRENPSKCDELARCTVLTGELTWTAPCLHRRSLYIRNQSLAACVYLGQPRDLHVPIQHRTSDIADRNYFNVANLILPVEPEYAFDVPHDRWLMQWFGVGAAILVVGRFAAAGVALAAGRKGNAFGAFAAFVISASLGAIGTTCLGLLSGEFVFTWPVSLYAAFEYVVSAGAEPKQATANRGSSCFNFLRKRAPLLCFLAISTIYFLGCRRLSLVFEWAFLAGFAGAVPILWLVYRRNHERTVGVFWQAAVSVIGFACFFATAVLLLKIRY